MSCTRLTQEQYTFNAVLGTVTLLGIHLESQQVLGIYRVIRDTGSVSTAKVALFQGLDPKGAASIAIVGSDTVVTLDFDTSGMDDLDELRIDLDLNGTKLIDFQGTMANTQAQTSCVFNKNNFKSFKLFIRAKGNLDFSYNRYTEPHAQGDNFPVQFALDDKAIILGSDRILTLTLSTIFPSGEITITNTTGGNVDVDFSVLGFSDELNNNVPINFELSSFLSLPTQKSLLGGFDRNFKSRNVGVTERNHLKVSDIDDTIYKDTFELSGPLPSGAMPAFDPVGPIVAANVKDSGWLKVDEVKNQYFHSTFDIAGVLVFLLNATDALGNNSTTQSFAFPTLVSNAGFQSEQIAAPFFQDYFRIVIINTTGLTANGYGWRSRSSNLVASPIYLSLNQTIFDFFPAPLNQSIVKAQDDVTGLFQAIESHQGNVTTSLAVHIGNRVSEVAGRTKVTATQVITAVATPITSIIYTPTVGTSLFVTKQSINLVNLVNGVGGILTVEDGASNIVQNYPIVPATNQNKTGLGESIVTENSPDEYTTDFTVTVPAGLLGSTLTINLSGYEEIL